MHLLDRTVDLHKMLLNAKGIVLYHKAHNAVSYNQYSYAFLDVQMSALLAA